MTEDEKVFKVTPAMDKKGRAELWKDARANPNLPNGDMLTVEYRGWSTAGIPLHAVGKAVRPRGT